MSTVLDASSYVDQCGCVGMHDGEPHWLHMNEMEERSNHKTFDAAYDAYEGVSSIMWDWFCEVEARRLASLQQNMERMGVSQIINRTRSCGDCHNLIQIDADQDVPLNERYCMEGQFDHQVSDMPFSGPAPRRVCCLFKWHMPSKGRYETNVSRRAHLIENEPVAADFWQLTPDSRKRLNDWFCERYGKQSDAMQAYPADSDRALYQIMSSLRSVSHEQWDWVDQQIEPARPKKPEPVTPQLSLFAL